MRWPSGEKLPPRKGPLVTATGDCAPASASHSVCDVSARSVAAIHHSRSLPGEYCTW